VQSLSTNGTLRLILTQALSLPETPYVVVPGAASLVVGGGIYLFLLEQQGESYIQRQDINLGRGMELFSLDYANNQLVVVTLDPRAGKPPFRPPRGGREVFELQGEKLVPLK
jgi:hypothetical protein